MLTYTQQEIRNVDAGSHFLNLYFLYENGSQENKSEYIWVSPKKMFTAYLFKNFKCVKKSDLKNPTFSVSVKSKFCIH